MNKKREIKNVKDRDSRFRREIFARVARKIKSKHNTTQTVWFGLGMMGLIGWSVVIPTLLGVALGIWLDKHYPVGHSWTLALMISGLIIGCFNAWYWVDKEDKEMRKRHENNNGSKDE